MNEGGETMGESIDDVVKRVKRVTRAAYTPGNVVRFTAVDLIRVLNELQRLRAENATLRASTDAAVDGVRAMLPEALRIAREEGAAEMRERCAIACNEISKGHNERAKACTKDRDEEWQWGHAGGADECIAAIRALPLAAPTEVTP